MGLLAALKALRSGKLVISRSYGSPFPMDPNEALQEAFERPEVQEKLREAGLDPATMQRKFESADIKLDGNRLTFTKSFSTKIDLPGHAQPPLPPASPAPAPETRPLSSEDGDDVWQTGKL
jgi:hypothetical protein